MVYVVEARIQGMILMLSLCPRECRQTRQCRLLFASQKVWMQERGLGSMDLQERLCERLEEHTESNVDQGLLCHMMNP